MFRNRIVCVAFAGAFLLATSAVSGQEFILPYLKTPETPGEFWAAVKYERQLGNYKRCAQMLAGMWAQVEKLDEAARRKFLLGLYDAEKMSTFLQLDRIPELDAAKAKDREGNDVRVTRLLVQEMEKYVEERIGNPERIKQFIANLSSKVKEERDYALYQLRLSGYRAVPHMLDAYRDKDRAREHVNIYNAWLHMDKDICPPLYAALATEDPLLRGHLIRLFLERADDRKTRAGLFPHLWYWHGKGDANASDALAVLLGGAGRPLPKESLKDPVPILTAEAEQYYLHKVEFPPHVKQFIWEFSDKDGLKGREATPTQVEEHFGTYWAKRALDLDPRYEPAQIVLASLWIEKATGRGGLDADLMQMLAGLDSALIEKVLARAMAEKRDEVARGALSVLVPLGDRRLIRNPESRPPLLQALKHPDRSVQLLAVDALMRMPGDQPLPESSRIVRILGRAFAAEPAAKAIIAMTDLQDARALEDVVRKWGYAAKGVNNAGELARLATESADVELIILDAGLPDPGLLQLLATFRTNPDLSGIPILVLGNDKVAAATLNEAAKYDRVRIVSPRPVGDAKLKTEHDHFFEELGRRYIGRFTDPQRQELSRQAGMMLLELSLNEKRGVDLRPLDDLFYHLLSRDDTAEVAASILAARVGPKGNELKTQDALIHVALSNGRPKAVRLAALFGVRTHVQRWGILVGQERLNQLAALPDALADRELKEEATRLAILLKPDPKRSGERLKDFTPKPPMPMPMDPPKP